MGIMQMIAAAGGLDAYLVSKSLRFDDGDGAYLNRAPSSAGSTTTFTWSGWVKLNNLAPVTHYLFTGVNSPYVDILAVRAGVPAGGSFSYYEAYTGWTVTSAALLRDPSAWYHLVCAVDTTQNTASDRIKLYINGVVVTSFTTTPVYSAENQVLGINAINTDVQIGRYFTTVTSDFQQAEVHYIDGQQLTASDFGETNATTGQWIPKDCSEDLTYGTNGFYLKFDNASDLGEDSSGNDNDFTANNLSTLVGNGNHASEVSGTPYSASYPITNMFNGLTNTYIAASSGSTTWTPVGGLSFTKLRAYLYQDSGTGEITFNWSGGSYTLSFTNATANYDWIDVTSNVTSPVTSIQWDTSGTTGPYVVGWEVDDVELIDNSFNADCDVSTDTPTPFDDGGNGTGNYCTMNPLQNIAGDTFSQGNLQVDTHSSNYGTHTSTLATPLSGKWYAEVTPTGSTVGYSIIGLVDTQAAHTTTSRHGIDLDGIGYYSSNGRRYIDQTSDTYGATYTVNDVIGIAYNADDQEAIFYKNNVSQGTISSVPLRHYYFGATDGDSGNGVTYEWNFGARDFTYTPPDGFKALNTYNLNTTTTLSGTYEGNGDADGPVIWMNATPATLKISSTNDPPQAGDAVTFSPTTVDPLAGGFKIRNASTNNGSGTTYYWLATTNRAFKYANAQSNE